MLSDGGNCEIRNSEGYLLVDGIDYASPIIADGKLYFTARNGDTYVFTAGKEFNQLAVNRVTTDPEEFSATPAISDGEIFIRSNKNLYCVSAEK